MRIRAEVRPRPRPRAEAAVAGRPEGRGSGAGTGAGTGNGTPKRGWETPKAEMGLWGWARGGGHWGSWGGSAGEPRRALEVGMGSGKWALGEAWGGRWETGLGVTVRGELGWWGLGGTPKWRGS